MASADLERLVEAISTGANLRAYKPEDREAEAAKIERLRQLRLAQNVSPKAAFKSRPSEPRRS